MGDSQFTFQSSELEGPTTNNQSAWCAAGSKGRGRASCVLLSGIMDLTYSPWWLSCDGMGNEDVFIGVGTLPRSENMETFETFFFCPLPFFKNWFF